MAGTPIIGEIIATSSLSFTAERLDPRGDGEPPRPVQPPNLGSLVWAALPEGGRVFAVVSFGTTGGLDPGRRVVARSRGELSDDQVYREHPELAHILRTEFEALLVGYEGPEGTIHRHLPPQPPPLHYAVYPCSPVEVRAFSEDLRYLRLLLNAQTSVPNEQLLAAHVREVHRSRGEDPAWLEGAARQVATLLRRDYERLRAALDAMA